MAGTMILSATGCGNGSDSASTGATDSSVNESVATTEGESTQEQETQKTLADYPKTDSFTIMVLPEA